MRAKKELFGTIIISSLLFSLVLCIYPARAHDLWLNVDQLYLKAGEETKFFIAFGHNFPHGDIVLKKEDVEVFAYLPGGKSQRIDTHEEGRFRAGKVKASEEGTIILSAYRKKKGTATAVPSEKYAKTLIQVGNRIDQILKPIGHRIELVPLTHPGAIKPGDSFPVKVFYKGKPLSTFVYGTYEGFRSEDEPFACTVKSDEQGIARIKIEREGRWLILCNHKVDFSCTLTFGVKP